MQLKDMRKTLYVSDMDGTLLNNKSVLSQETKTKLNTLIENGCAFTIATARTPATVSFLMKDVNANLPFIVMAGCAFWNSRKCEFESVRLLEAQHVSQIIDIFDEYGNTPFIYNKNGNSIIVNHKEYLSPQEKAFIEPRINTPLKQFEKVSRLQPNNKYNGVMLIFGMGEYFLLRKIADEITKQNIPCSFNCYHDIFDLSQGFIDIYLKGTTKAAAIKQLAKEIDAQRIVCFGDNLNDIPMMEMADWSLAVDNAFDEVKECADEIIASNNDNAVVNWIEKDFINS